MGVDGKGRKVIQGKDANGTNDLSHTEGRGMEAEKSPLPFKRGKFLFGATWNFSCNKNEGMIELIAKIGQFHNTETQAAR